MRKTSWMIGVSAVVLAACSGGTEAPEETLEAETPPMVEEAEATGPMNLADVVAGEWRSDDEKARDAWRNPAETWPFSRLSPATQLSKFGQAVVGTPTFSRLISLLATAN